MDKKGGHLAEDKNGKLILRESAQCPQEEIAHFQDINFYKYFNTNNLWVDLDSLAQKLAENNNYLNLNPIMNHKEVDGVEVIQLETAMGSAINLFDDSRAIVVNRDRFVPVKKTNEFLAVRSDAYLLDDNWRITLQPGKDKAPQIELDEEYYQTINDFEEKFLGGYPSLRDCESLHIRGNIHFGKNVSFSGKVRLSNAESKLFIENKVFDNVAIQW
jgi:UDP-N-acetylglucosamine pyrophosphorylase